MSPVHPTGLQRIVRIGRGSTIPLPNRTLLTQHEGHRDQLSIVVAIQSQLLKHQPLACIQDQPAKETQRHSLAISRSEKTSPFPALCGWESMSKANETTMLPDLGDVPWETPRLSTQERCPRELHSVLPRGRTTRNMLPSHLGDVCAKGNDTVASSGDTSWPAVRQTRAAGSGAAVSLSALRHTVAETASDDPRLRYFHNPRRGAEQSRRSNSATQPGALLLPRSAPDSSCSPSPA